MNKAIPDIAAMNAEERCAYFAPLFTPRTIAVVGASASGKNRANIFIAKLQALGYTGKIFPVHHQAEEVDGMKAYPSLGAIPETVDYAYVAIPAKAVPGAIATANGNVKFAHITAGGFADVEAGKGLQGELVAAAHGAGMRLLGPNCNGGYSPEGRLSMVSGVSADVGSIGIISQSGGLSTDFIRRGQARGLGFRSVMALGNSADINPSDLLDFHLVDPKTKVIGLYLESIGDGRRLFKTLKQAKGIKPVVLLKGGQTQDGSRAVSSHTGTLAGDLAAWTSLCKQTGMTMVDTLDAFLDTLHGFQMFTPKPERPTQTAVFLGNGGGTSVLGVDAFSRIGIRLPKLDAETYEALAALKLPAGAGTSNPLDVSRAALVLEEGRTAESLMDIILTRQPPDVFVLHINLPVILTQSGGKDSVITLIEAAVRVLERHRGTSHFAVVLRSDGTEEIDAKKRTHRVYALENGIAVFDEMPAAAQSIGALAAYERFLAARRG